MSIASQRYVFKKSNVDVAPDNPGVYGLYNASGEVIYYGMSEVSIRSRLQSHQAGNEGPCTAWAHSYNYEACSNPVVREIGLLAAHELIHGSMPRCNEVRP